MRTPTWTGGPEGGASLAGGVRSIDEFCAHRRAGARAHPGDWIVTMPLGDPPEFEGMPEPAARTPLPDQVWDLDRVAPETRSLSSRAGGTGASPSRSLGSPTVARWPLPASTTKRNRLPRRSLSIAMPAARRPASSAISTRCRSRADAHARQRRRSILQRAPARSRALCGSTTASGPPGYLKATASPAM